MTCLLLWVYIYFWPEVFRFRGGWVGPGKSEHCSDFKNTYVFLDAPLRKVEIMRQCIDQLPTHSMILSIWCWVHQGFPLKRIINKNSLEASYLSQKVSPLKLHCYSGHGQLIHWMADRPMLSLTFVAINRTTRYQFWLICISCMWFHFRIGQNGIGKNPL